MERFGRFGKLWEGLGYYSRARNLHKGAKMVFNEKMGVLPDNYDDLLKNVNCTFE